MQVIPYFRYKPLSKEILYLFSLKNSSQYFMSRLNICLQVDVLKAPSRKDILFLGKPLIGIFGWLYS